MSDPVYSVDGDYLGECYCTPYNMTCTILVQTPTNSFSSYHYLDMFIMDVYNTPMTKESIANERNMVLSWNDPRCAWKPENHREGSTS